MIEIRSQARQTGEHSLTWPRRRVAKCFDQPSRGRGSSLIIGEDWSWDREFHPTGCPAEMWTFATCTGDDRRWSFQFAHGTSRARELNLANALGLSAN